MPVNSHLQWTVPYAPGTLAAKGYKHGAVIAETKVETTGEPAAVQLTPDRITINADGEDVSVVTVSVTDAQGRLVPVAGNLVNFAVTGGGKIIGVGNGDPSCHEPDVYATASAGQTLVPGNWRMKLVAAPENRPEIAPDFVDADWSAADVTVGQGPLEPHTSAVFRGHVTVPEDALPGSAVLHIGSIDDEGWVYVNGLLAGESHDWQDSPVIEAGKFLHAGDNVIAVVVRNQEGAGGLNKGVSLVLSSQAVVPAWKRSVFNGLAQVLVQAGKTAGDIRLSARAEGLTGTTVVIRGAEHAGRAALP